MGSLVPYWVGLLVVVAILSAMGGFVASTAMRRNKRHTRRIFALGAFCGFLAGATVAGRHSAAARTRAVLRRSGIRSLTRLALASRPARRRWLSTGR
ncbi:hypothetical protein [Mycolicibacterium novocastrense]|uniref:hypothetical protein n=1 Tax=Mycolicibacterium novocastrense TaxID=59813 RepID=UPI000746A558|nr:hypothetical protein [Mycolicibacterium novocastrense]KUH69063.1 hypothetical protein AU183_00985 [Mycolicibacterium novocastrense]KUH69259.1 hypothetical protein AU072_14385 [Mycolicibacterium novocastrense]